MTKREREDLGGLVLLVLLANFGCSDVLKNLPPIPPAPPTPTPVDTHQPVCAPPALVTGCYHQPSTDGPDGGWLFIPASTQPTLPPPAPVPPPSSGCRYPLSEAQLVPVAVQDGSSGRTAQVLNAERAIGDVRRPTSNPTALARENNRLLAGYLRGSGFCAFVGQEAVFVQESDGTWAEFHAAAETDGGWTQNPYKGDHQNAGGTSPTPPDAPPITGQPPAGPANPAPPAPSPGSPSPGPAQPAPPAGGCNALPCPRIAWTAETLPEGWSSDLIGKPAWEFASAPYPKGSTDKDRDFTPKQRRNPAFCEAVGFNAPVIADCPLGKDGDPLRPERERYLLAGGFHREGRFPENDASCEPRSGAPSMIRNGTTNCRMCDSRRFDDPLRVCSDWF